MSALPANIPPRCMSLEQACEYVGLTNANTFQKAVDAGIFRPVPYRDHAGIRKTVFDRKALDKALDEIGGLTNDDDMAKRLLRERINGRAKRGKAAVSYPAPQH
tara:strand:- start:60 stop:371 length:312 start_codon:yes stop_codon:yes gene_type:complete